MKESEFDEIEFAGWELGFHVGLFGTERYNEKEQKKAKRKMLRLKNHFCNVKEVKR